MQSVKDISQDFMKAHTIDCEAAIYAAIKAFEANTGMEITDIQLHREKCEISRGRKINLGLKIFIHFTFPH